jgi:hypothetical protein
MAAMSAKERILPMDVMHRNAPTPLELAYQQVADVFSGKRQASPPYYQPIFVLDEEWNLLLQKEQQHPDMQEEIANQRAKRERVLARDFEASRYAKRKEPERKPNRSGSQNLDLLKQAEEIEERLRIHPRIGLQYSFQVAQQRLFEAQQKEKMEEYSYDPPVVIEKKRMIRPQCVVEKPYEPSVSPVVVERKRIIRPRCVVEKTHTRAITPIRMEQCVFRMIVEMMYEIAGAEQCMEASIAAIPRAFRAIVSPDIEGAPWHEEGRPWLSRHLQQLRCSAGGSIESLVRNERTVAAKKLHGTPITYIRPDTTHYTCPPTSIVFTNGFHHQIVQYSLHMSSDDKPVSTFTCCRTYAEADKQTTAERFTYDATMTITFLSDHDRQSHTIIPLPPFLSEDLWRKQKQDEKYTAYEESYAKSI